MLPLPVTFNCCSILLSSCLRCFGYNRGHGHWVPTTCLTLQLIKLKKMYLFMEEVYEIVNLRLHVIGDLYKTVESSMTWTEPTINLLRSILCNDLARANIEFAQIRSISPSVVFRRLNKTPPEDRA